MIVQDGQKNQNNLTDVDPIDSIVCDTFFSEDSPSEDEIKDMLDNLQLSLSNSDKTSSKHVHYNTIAKETFDFYSKNRYKGLADKKIEDRLGSIEEVIAKYNDKYIDVEHIIHDFVEHANLVIEEAKYVGNIAGEAREAAKSAERKAKNATGNNITILGIFTAITFAVFGGMQTFSSLFSNMNMASAPIKTYGFILATGAVFGLILYGIIIVLFYGIAKLTSDKEEYSVSPKLTKWILSILAIMFGVGTYIVINCK